MSERTPIARSLPDKLRIELNHLSMALSRCADQAECDRIMARMREIERTGLLRGLHAYSPLLSLRRKRAA